MRVMTTAWSWPLAGLVVLFGCGSQPTDVAATDQEGGETSAPIQLAQAPAAAPVAGGGGAIQGTVRFSGTAPTMEKISMAADPACAQQHPQTRYAEDVVVNEDGTLQNVFVSVTEGVTGEYPPPSAAATLDQRGCWYRPHVLGVQTNQPIEIVNSDPTLHNVNAKPTENPPFNIAQPVQGMKTTKKFTKPEIMVSTKCNVHPWMQAYIGVVEHPFFGVTGSDGRVQISGLPPGTYTLEAWHERYGTQTQQVTVTEGDTAAVEFTFEAP